MSGVSVLLAGCAVGAALVAGIFYAFSTFIMGALGRLEAAAGIAAMQSINVVVINPWFFLAFFGTGLASVAALVHGSMSDSPMGVAVPLGCALYLIGCIGVTLVFNVPLNDRLAAVETIDESAIALWQHYLARWTLWNHVRTAASLLASIVWLMAMVPARP